MSEEYQIFQQNMKRATDIISVAKKIESPGTNKSDVLRAVVVLIHSSFETYYRSVLLKKLPFSDDNVLDSIKILNANNDKKIPLSKIRSYGSMSASEIVHKSIEEHLSNTSFNDYDDICSWAKKININMIDFKNAEELNNMIHRRHKIVHEADLTNEVNGKTRLTPLGDKIVEKWFTVVENIVDIIDKQL